MKHVPQYSDQIWAYSHPVGCWQMALDWLVDNQFINMESQLDLFVPTLRARKREIEGERESEEKIIPLFIENEISLGRTVPRTSCFPCSIYLTSPEVEEGDLGSALDYGTIVPWVRWGRSFDLQGQIITNLKWWWWFQPSFLLLQSLEHWVNLVELFRTKWVRSSAMIFLKSDLFW